jgi:hypothetical protein
MPDIGAFYTATIKRQILPKIEDAVIERNELLKFLKDKKCISYGNGGDGFQFRVRNGESTIGGSTSDWGVRNFQTTQPFTALTNTYRQYSWSLAVSLFQMQRNQNAGPEAKMFKMLAEQANEVRQAATYRLGYHAYNGNTATTTGDTSTPIDGLADIIATTNTYSGVDRSVSANAYFRAQSKTVAKFTADTDTTGVNDGVNSMEELWLACCRGKQSGDGIPDSVATEKDEPDGIATTPDILRAYFLSLAPQYRYNDGKADPNKTLTFHGVPIFWDNVCPSGKMWFLNSRHLNFDVVGDELISVLVERDEPNPPTHIWLVGGQYQFYSTNPRYQGVLNVTAI